nr:DapH/DapD/GlmU-related protein [Sphingobium sp. B2]
MAIHSLNRLKALRQFLIGMRRAWLVRVKGISIDPSVSISLSSRFIAGRRNDIVIGPQTLVAFKTLVYSQDSATGEHRPVHIGRHCFIGGGSLIAPGVRIGDGVIVGAGSVVLADVPDYSIVGGNPAQVLRSNADVGPYGRLRSADQNVRQNWR